jgi:hypothetical protein
MPGVTGCSALLGGAGGSALLGLAAGSAVGGVAGASLAAVRRWWSPSVAGRASPLGAGADAASERRD